MKKRFVIIYLSCCILMFSLLGGCSGSSAETEKAPETAAETQTVSTETHPETITEVQTDIAENTEPMTEPVPEGILSSPEDIGLTNASGDGANYTFIYGEETFTAIYTPDNWKIIDSYRIDNSDDMRIICEALTAEHPIHGSDMQSYRTPEDMAYEWIQHNLCYALLPEGSSWIENVKDVDLDPRDQGRSFMEIYEDRTGKPFNPLDVLN